MISPEILRRYPFFSKLSDPDLKAIAMISEEETYKQGDVIYTSGKPNPSVLLLETGCIESFLVIEDPNQPASHNEYYLDDIDPGEVFGISAMVAGKLHTTTARASRAGKLVRIDAVKLERLCEADTALGYVLMKEMADTLLYRLQQDRIQLAACRS
jgi:CRP-like cAMP-binding protein